MNGRKEERPVPAPGADAPPPPAGERSDQPLDEERLLASFDEGRLARLLRLLFPLSDLGDLTRDVKAKPKPGKRVQSMTADEHARAVAERALRDRRSRLRLLERVRERLGGGELPPYLRDVPADAIEDVLDLIGKLPGVDRARLLLSWLDRDDLRARVEQAFDDEALTRPLDSDEEERRREADRRVREAGRRVREAEERAGRLADAEKRERKRAEDLERRLDQQKKESDELRRRLGESHDRQEELEQLYGKAKSDLKKAEERAARYKRQLRETREPSEREKELEAEIRRLRAELDKERQKIELLEWQLDQIEHEDRIKDEEIAAPAPPVDKLAERSALAAQRRGRRLRVLVLGGAGKQRRHREERFPALTERLALEGDWEFADYRSWHRNLARLRNDLKERYDLVFVLHWNRTTFVRKMQEEGRKTGVKVRTVRYEGFTSLEQAIREELETWLDREGT